MRTKAKKHRASPAINAIGLVLAVALLAFGLAKNPPARIGEAADRSLAAAMVSISAGVAPNPDNTLAQELQTQAQQLQAQEKAAQQRASAQSPLDSLGLYSLLASLALLFLVGANFYFDWKRQRATGGASKSLLIDLKARR